MDNKINEQDASRQRPAQLMMNAIAYDQHLKYPSTREPPLVSSNAALHNMDDTDDIESIIRRAQQAQTNMPITQQELSQRDDGETPNVGTGLTPLQEKMERESAQAQHQYFSLANAGTNREVDDYSETSSPAIINTNNKRQIQTNVSSQVFQDMYVDTNRSPNIMGNNHHDLVQSPDLNEYHQEVNFGEFAQNQSEQYQLNDYNQQLQVIKEMQDRLLATGHQQPSMESYKNVNSRDDMLNSLNNEYINSMSDIAKFGKVQGKSAADLKTNVHLKSGQDTGHFNSQTQSIPDGANGVGSTSQTIQNLQPIDELDSQAEAILVPLESSHPSQVDLKLNILKTTTRSTNRNHSKVTQSQNFDHLIKQKTNNSNNGRSDNSRGKSHDSYAQHSPLHYEQQRQDSVGKKSGVSRNMGMRTKSVESGNGLSVRITNQNGNTIPSSIHSESGLRFNVSTFAQRFNKLYGNIQQIFPTFIDEIGPINHLDNVNEGDLPFNAGQVFQQMSFMYQTAKALKLKEVNRSRSQSKQGIEQFSKQKGRKDSDLDGLMNDQAQVANNMLKYQLENVQREAEYYKKQMDVFKEQLQISALRERDNESQYDQRIQDLNLENSNYQRRVDELDNIIIQLQQRNSQLSGNVSFRAKTKDSSAEADLPAFRPRELEMSPKVEDTRLINSLQNEAKELRIKVKIEKEAAEFEKQRNRDFQQRLDGATNAFQAEIVQIRRENELLREEKDQKGKTIDQLNEQLQDFARNVSIEFPLIVKTEVANTGVHVPSPGLQLNGALQTSAVNLSNQKSSARYVQMNHQKSQKKGEISLNLDMDQILNDMPFMNNNENAEQEMDQNDFKMRKNSQMPLRGKSSNGLRKKGRKAEDKNQAAVAHTNQMAKFFEVQQMAKSQIASVLIADQIIKEQETLKKDKNARLDKQLEIYNDIEKRMELIQNEKKEFNDKQIALTKENEDLKVKFSQLLDQFQEYVNESEKKIEEEQHLQKDEQERILGDLNGTIKELEDMSKNLQRECQNKDTQIQAMQDELNKMDKDCKEMREQKEQTEKHQDGIQVVKMQSLNDEISYLKKHYMVEMDILRNENKLLRQKGRTNNCNTPVQERTYDNRDIQISPYPQNNRNDQDFHRDDNDLRLSRQKSQMMNRQNNHDGNSQYAVPYGENLSAIDRRDGFSDRDNSLFVSGPQREAQQDYAMAPNYNQHQNRAKSHDRVIGQQRPSYHREPHHDHHEDRRSFSRERDNRQDYTNYHSRDHSAENQPAKAKNILSGVQVTIDGMKRDLKDKDRLIEQKNREIVKLRMENDEYKSNFENVDSLVVSQHQRNKIVNEMESVVDTLKLELERTKRSLFKEESQQSLNSPVMHNAERTQSQHVITCEDKLIQMVMDKIKTMRGLISLASEIFLLSNKQKYGPEQNMNTQSNSENDHLLQENKSLHRKIYKYETTMQQMDDIFRREDQKDEIIFELKKLTQNQLQEILKLQNQQQLHQQMNQQMGDIKPSQQHQDLFQENRVLKQEISLMREQAARSQQLQDGNNELMNERRTLLLKVEQLDSDYKDSQNQLNEISALKRESDKQFEELRIRITVVAELFEKKPIKQKYSFEVLCDFIHDKAKRLFTKYENAVKEKKSMQEEKSYYFQRKIQELQKEKEQNKESIQSVKNNLIPKISNLLNKSFNSKDVDRLSSSFLREISDDLEYQFTKYKQDFFKNQQNQERVKELQMMVDRLSNPHGFQNSQSNYTNIVEQKPVNSYGHTETSQNFSNNNNNVGGISQQEFEQMRQEKMQLNKKLDEFSNILQDFKSNQRTQSDENNQLKQKINLLEQQKSHYKFSETGFDGNSNSHMLEQATLLGNKPIQVSDHMTLMSQDRTIDPTVGPLSNGNNINQSQFGQPFSSTSTQNLAMNPNIIHSNPRASNTVQGVINSEWGENETEINHRQNIDQYSKQ